MVRALPLVIVAWVSLAGCGPDARRHAADSTVHAAREALMHVERTSGGDEALRAPLERSRTWLERSEEGIDVWGSSGSLAYETAAPCLGRALGELRDALIARGREVPVELEEAEAGALAATERRCATR